MIDRIWRSWTTRDRADAYQKALCETVIPALEARAVAGLLQIDILRRDVGDEVEFTTIMQFDTAEAIARFAGDASTRIAVPPVLRPLLVRCDDDATHHDVIDRRVQAEYARGRS